MTNTLKSVTSPKSKEMLRSRFFRKPLAVRRPTVIMKSPMLLRKVSKQSKILKRSIKTKLPNSIRRLPSL